MATIAPNNNNNNGRRRTNGSSNGEPDQDDNHPHPASIVPATPMTPAQVTVTTSFKAELQEILTLAAPVAITTVFEQTPALISLLFVGMIGNASQLAAAALANTFMNFTAVTVGSGLNSALDTLCAHSYGRGNIREMGLWLQRGIIIVTLAMIPCAFIVIFSYHILTGCGQDSIIANDTRKFLMGLLPGLLPSMYYDAMKKVLQTHGNVGAVSIISVLVYSANIGICYSFIFVSGWGYLGAAYARSMCNFLLFICLFIYFLISGSWRRMMPRLSMAVFQQWGEYFKLAIPGWFVYAADQNISEMLVIIAGYLTNPALAIAATGIVCTISNVTWSPLWAISVAAAVRVGNLLGHRQPDNARLSSLVAIIASCVTAVPFVIIWLVWRWSLGAIFTSHQPITNLVGYVLLWYFMKPLAEAPSTALQGVFRGAALTDIGAMINFATEWCIGISLGAIMAIPMKLDLAGLFLGSLIGVTMSTIVYLIWFVMYADWNALVEKTMRLASSSSASAAHVANTTSGDGSDDNDANDTAPLLVPSSTRSVDDVSTTNSSGGTHPHEASPYL